LVRLATLKRNRVIQEIQEFGALQVLVPGDGEKHRREK
jgi:hypothetical protein